MGLLSVSVDGIFALTGDGADHEACAARAAKNAVLESKASAPTWLPYQRVPPPLPKLLDHKHEQPIPLVTAELIRKAEAEAASRACLDLHLLRPEDDSHASLFKSGSWEAVEESLRGVEIECPLRGLYDCVWQGKPALRVRLELTDIKALHVLRGKLMGDGSRSSGTLLAGIDSSECALVTFHSSPVTAHGLAWRGRAGATTERRARRRASAAWQHRVCFGVRGSSTGPEQADGGAAGGNQNVRYRL